MPRHLAFLRGVSPQNLSMPELKAALETAGFERVRTLLSSGNVAFDAGAQPATELAARIEAAVQQRTGRRFATTVRTQAELSALLQRDPFAGCGLPADAKRVVSFLYGAQTPRVPLPLTLGEATVIRQHGSEVYTAYRPGPDGPVFMRLIERAFGHEVTTRTWDTVRKCAAA